MLNKIIYSKLFGIFDYNIQLKKEGVTIITGPNGFGKSTILKSINAFYTFDFMFFWELDFERINFYSDEFDEPICIKKKEQELIIDGFSINIGYFQKEINKYFSKFEENRWLAMHQDEPITKEAALEKFLKSNEIIGGEKLDKIREKLRKYSGETKFIKEQRLLREETISRFEEKAMSIIEDLPNKFIKKMNMVSSKYSSEANRLDSSYPNRLFKTTNGITKDEYENSIKLMNERFEKLNKYNISDIKGLEEQNIFQDEHSKALKIYFDDFEKNMKCLRIL